MWLATSSFIPHPYLLTYSSFHPHPTSSHPSSSPSFTSSIFLLIVYLTLSHLQLFIIFYSSWLLLLIPFPLLTSSRPSPPHPCFSLQFSVFFFILCSSWFLSHYSDAHLPYSSSSFHSSSIIFTHSHHTILHTSLSTSLN